MSAAALDTSTAEGRLSPPTSSCPAAWVPATTLRPVTLSVHVYSVRVEREAHYDLGLSFSIARLLGEALRVSVGSNCKIWRHLTAILAGFDRSCDDI